MKTILKFFFILVLVSAKGCKDNATVNEKVSNSERTSSYDVNFRIFDVRQSSYAEKMREKKVQTKDTEFQGGEFLKNRARRLNYKPSEEYWELVNNKVYFLIDENYAASWKFLNSLKQLLFKDLNSKGFEETTTRKEAGLLIWIHSSQSHDYRPIMDGKKFIFRNYQAGKAVNSRIRMSFYRMENGVAPFGLLDAYANTYFRVQELMENKILKEVTNNLDKILKYKLDEKVSKQTDPGCYYSLGIMKFNDMVYDFHLQSPAFNSGIKTGHLIFSSRPNISKDEILNMNSDQLRKAEHEVLYYDKYEPLKIRQVLITPKLLCFD